MRNKYTSICLEMFDNYTKDNSIIQTNLYNFKEMFLTTFVKV